MILYMIDIGYQQYRCTNTDGYTARHSILLGIRYRTYRTVYYSLAYGNEEVR